MSYRDSVSFPLWLRTSFVLIAMALTLLLAFKFYLDSFPDQRLRSAAISGSEHRHNHYQSIWPKLEIVVHGIARVDHQTVVVRWSYRNIGHADQTPFSWSVGSENWVEKTKLIDAAGVVHGIRRNAGGTPSCSSIFTDGQTGQSARIAGGEELSAWAEFHLPRNQATAYRLRIYGLINKGASEITVGITSPTDAQSPIFEPRRTSWDDISIQLTEVRHDDDGTLVVRWNYVNNGIKKSFRWGFNQPDYVSQTQLYDRETGRYHQVHRYRRAGSMKYACSSTNKNDGSGWSYEISAGGTLPAFAVFKGVRGASVEILFRSDSVDLGKPRTMARMTP